MPGIVLSIGDIVKNNRDKVPTFVGFTFYLSRQKKYINKQEYFR